MVERFSQGIALNEMGSLTLMAFASVIPILKFLQDNKHAFLGPTSPGFGRLVCELHTGGKNYRPDINKNRPSELPICENTPANETIMGNFIRAIIKMAIEIYGMRKEDEEYLKILAFLWGIESGMGSHGDYAGEVDKKRFITRLIASMGEETRTITFTRHKFVTSKDGNSRVDGNSTTLYEGGTFKTVTLPKNGSVYITTPAVSGKVPFCFLDEEKSEGIQLKHRVERIPANGKACVNFIIDIPFRSEHEMMTAIDTVNAYGFVLPLESSMEEYMAVKAKIDAVRAEAKREAGGRS